MNRHNEMRFNLECKYRLKCVYFGLQWGGGAGGWGGGRIHSVTPKEHEFISTSCEISRVLEFTPREL